MRETPNPSRDAEVQHLDEMTCMLYNERQLERARAQEVSAHAQECAACQTLLRAIERESRLLTRAMLEAEEALPTRLEQFQERARRSMQWVWGVALGLAATGAYALYTGYVEPWQQRLETAGFGGSNLLSLLIFQGAFWKGWQSMITTLEVLAMLTVAGFGLVLGRRRVRRTSAWAVVLLGFGTALAMPPASPATEFRKGDSIAVAQGETIKGDVYLFGNRARVEGTVDGDVFIFSHDAVVNGHVTGDVIALAQVLQINGQVDGNVRSGVNTLTVSGTVGRSVTVFGDSVNLDSRGKIGGTLTTFAGRDLSLEGQLVRDLYVYARHAEISGTIGGGIRARGDTLILTERASVGGPIRFEGKSPADVSPRAKLASAVEYHKLEKATTYSRGNYFIWQVIWGAAFVLFGLVLFLLMPQFSGEAADSAEHYGASLGLGVLVVFGVPIAALLACITVVGLFVGISAFFLWYAALYYAQVIIGAVVGQWLLGRTREIWPLIGRTIVGVLLVRLCTTIPFAGGWIKFGVIVWGLGATSLALYRRFQPPTAPGTFAPLGPNAGIGVAQPA